MSSKALLDDTSSGSDDGGVLLDDGSDFKVNQDFARRFEHNKKREELQQLEEKLGKSTGKRKRPVDDDAGSESSIESSSSEDEDDEGELATVAVDSEISEVLDAIRNKDPRLYDEKITFYKSIKDDVQQEGTKEKQKPMYLRDYHRENLLNGGQGEPDDGGPRTYAQEQEDLKESIVKEIHAAAAKEGEDSSSDNEEYASDDGGFLVPKPSSKKAISQPRVQLDVENADKDPETFLSNFMASRAWVPTDKSRFQPLESDDEEEERKAEEFEHAYNLRFEDPDKANEKLVSHARDIAAQRSVRREEANPRKKRRETERERKEAEKQEREEQKLRLRKLKIEQMENKIKKIKQAAGLSGKTIQEDDWAKFLDEGWDDERWEQEMQRRFGENYYEGADAVSDEDASTLQSRKKRKPKKPKWNDDIDIKDLVPDFVDEERPDLSLSEEDNQATVAISKQKKRKELIKSQNDKKREARKERRKIEQLVDEQLDLEPTLLPGASKKRSVFRYRETSPLSYGLSARDILMAEDSQLNEFAGLKKLAAFRDAEKKKRDQKKLGKKARLRQWRRETFGDEEGPRVEVLEAPQVAAPHQELDVDGLDIGQTEKKRKHRRSKKSKKSVELA